MTTENKKLLLQSFGFVCGLVCLVFFFSLFQAARSDQLFFYFPHQAKHLDDLYKLTFGSYSLTRSSNNYDPALFRPALYIFLGLLSWLFKYNFLLWQLASITLHCLVVYILLKLFYIINRNIYSIFSVVFSLFFAFQYASMEMVTWHHIIGYLLFSFLILLALYHFKKYSLFGNASSLIYLGICLLISVFTYEFGNIAAIIFSIFIILHNNFVKRKSEYCRKVFPKTLIYFLLLLPILYFTVNFIDLYKRAMLPSALNQVSHGKILDSLIHSFYSIGIWIYSAFVPAAVNLSPGNRVVLLGFKEINNLYVQLGVIVGVIFCISFIILLLQGAFKRALKKEWLFLSMVLSLIISYTGLIMYGRGSVFGFFQSLQWNIYYSYFVILLVSIILFIFVSQLSELNKQNLLVNKFSKYSMLFSLIIIIAWNGFSIFNMNLKMTAFNLPRLTLVKNIHKLIGSHGSEKGFSFSVVLPCKANEPLLPERFPLAEALFPDFYRRYTGKYLVSCK